MNATVTLAARLRLIQGFQSLREFSRKINRPPTTVRLWLKDPGGVIPDVMTLYDVADKTGRSPHWLITGEGPEYAEDFKAALTRSA